MKSRGFTLIELMIVIAIVAIVATVASTVIFPDTKFSRGPARTVYIEPAPVQPSTVPQCVGGYLMRGNSGVTDADGKIVKC